LIIGIFDSSISRILSAMDVSGGVVSLAAFLSLNADVIKNRQKQHSPPGASEHGRPGDDPHAHDGRMITGLPEVRSNGMPVEMGSMIS
jgi:hypothetical protein